MKVSVSFCVVCGGKICPVIEIKWIIRRLGFLEDSLCSARLFSSLGCLERGHSVTFNFARCLVQITAYFWSTSVRIGQNHVERMYRKRCNSRALHKRAWLYVLEIEVKRCTGQIELCILKFPEASGTLHVIKNTQPFTTPLGKWDGLISYFGCEISVNSFC